MAKERANGVIPAHAPEPSLARDPRGFPTLGLAEGSLTGVRVSLADNAQYAILVRDKYVDIVPLRGRSRAAASHRLGVMNEPVSAVVHIRALASSGRRRVGLESGGNAGDFDELHPLG